MLEITMTRRTNRGIQGEHFYSLQMHEPSIRNFINFCEGDFTGLILKIYLYQSLIKDFGSDGHQ